ncbi:hypothetical protein ACIBHY_23760 [Nonomuraea sp. NPDC050547]|uniref:hypothetical protein n=1 Tax=unclassified Nonomuraea TaxID=2593643 RepID=UPI0037B0E289
MSRVRRLPASSSGVSLSSIYAIDAVVAATALRSERPAIVLTSDEDDMSKLCEKAVRVVPV